MATQSKTRPEPEVALPLAAPRRHHVPVELVVPVYNEERGLEASIRRLHAYVHGPFPFRARIVIADNASTDRTLALAERLAAELDDVEVVHLEAKGRGRALRTTWERSDSDVVAYMDVDLSTDLAALLPLVAPLLSGHSDVAIGTRLSRSSRVVRGPKRELISRSYNLILRTTLRASFSDAQCGFKAIRTDRAKELLPYVQDTGWFFDTELLVIAERAGLRIHEVPVDWVDDPDSRVAIVETAMADLRGIVRVGRSLASGAIPLSQIGGRAKAAALGADLDAGPSMVGQLVRFAIVGVLSTVAYVVLYLAMRTAVGAQTANAAALLLTAVGNTAVNRRFTFGVRGSARVVRHQFQGLIVFAVGLSLTAGSLLVLHALSASPPRWLELTVLVAANLVATLVRFLLFRVWVFHPRASRTVLALAPVTERTSS
jgi:putative flippase GtrA